VSIFHTYSFEINQFNVWNFNGTFLGSGGNLSFNSEYKNNWHFGAELGYHAATTDTRFLRGGPQMKLPDIIEVSGHLSTDRSKRIVFNFSTGYESRGNNSASSYSFGPGISVRPFQLLKVSVTASMMNNHDQLQYITSLDYMSSKRYILGTLNQKTVNLTFRLDLNITPEFSVQYYGSPFVSRGSYSEFKYITDPRAKEFKDRFRIYNNAQLNNGNYGLDESGDLVADYYITNPDFNFHEFRSNFVAKWEYRLGSFIYLVWSTDMTGYTGSSHASYGESLNQLLKVYPNNMFIVKLSYWFSL
jgi:hypothetical protein